MKLGFVSIVGAGPGDPDLLTVKAVDRLSRADLVLYDALVTPAVLQRAPRAQCFFVGKRAHRAAITQDAINHLLIRAARRGRRVVRLKAGDPFVLGRGGEEALALRAAGIPFEVVPGVTSAVAAPELAGVPVTHRGVSSGFAVVSGHADEAYREILEAIAPQSLTLVVLMGLARRAAIARLLIERGWRPATPAAIVWGASTPEMRVWRGRLDELADASADRETDAPGTIIIGEVVAVGAIIAERLDPASTMAAMAGR